MKLAVTQMILGFLVLVCGATLLFFDLREITQGKSVTSFTIQTTSGDIPGSVTITFPSDISPQTVIAVPQESVYPVSFGASLYTGYILPVCGLVIIICGIFQLRNSRKNRANPQMNSLPS
ncbi:MAG TPA: hypothetical protein VEH58_05200 [Dehalococcoidales bacterium]|nr:hypothetical protein [Dehalococcoidales bacterium]